MADHDCGEGVLEHAPNSRPPPGGAPRCACPGPSGPPGGADPAEEALLADSVSLALLVVLDTLTPAERLAFVLHDLFDLPFEEIAPLVDRTASATRQLASRARRRVKGAEPADLDVDLTRQQHVVDAFFAAARHGDFDGLVAVLHPDVILRIDAGPRLRGASMMVQGAASVAEQASKGLAVLARPVVRINPAVVNGGAGVVVTASGRPVTVMGFTVHNDRIVEIDAIADPGRVPRIVASLIDITSEDGTASE
jgi:ketosteroid isomerase-like protein